MTTINQQHPVHIPNTIVSGDDISPRHAPLLEVGPLAWVKKNLFNTLSDTILTFVVIAIVISVVVSFVTWTVGQANWYTINFNLRLLMLGRFEPEAEWRITLVVLMTAFTIGIALAAWARIGRGLALFIVGLIALTFIVPMVIYTALPLPNYYASAGQVRIGGDNGQLPQPQMAFTGRAGETVTVRFADQYADTDASLAQVNSFADAATNAALNLAGNRLTTEAQINDLKKLLAGDTLTDRQRTRAEFDLKALKDSDPIVDSLKLNQQPVKVSILQGTTMEPLPDGEITLTDSQSLLTVTLPADGWYILQKEIDDPDSAAILETHGIYPILQRNITRGAEDEGPAIGSIAQYVRMTDLYTTEAELPLRENGRTLPFIVVTSNQYRGMTPFSDYLRLYVAPFLNQINSFLLIVCVVAAIGYFIGRMLDWFLSPELHPHQLSSRTAVWLLGVVPILSFVAIWGFTNDGVRQFLILLFTLAWLFAAYLAGTQFAQSRNVLALSTLVVVAVVGIIFRGQNLVYGLLSNALNTLEANPNLILVIVVALTILVGIIAALIGRTRGQNTSSLAFMVGLIVCAVIIVICVFGASRLPPLLADAVPLTDTRRWGGVLLTMLLTIVGIIGSLPLGILLALGRRSKLPVLSTACTIYIELVRGIPFITVLFMATLLIPLINPSLASFPSAFRAMIATVLFTAAYIAEVVRGGLQAIPTGQDEAAKALGLGGIQVTLFITLPQALRLVIPPMMGSFIGMFKDTSLVAIVGLLDLTGMAQNVVSQTEFLGLRRETFMFISIFYFVFSYFIAAISRRIEATGAGQALRTQI